jgi:hypothetical protein
LRRRHQERHDVALEDRAPVKIEANTLCLVTLVLLMPTRHVDELPLRRRDHPQAPGEAPDLAILFPSPCVSACGANHHVVVAPCVS